MSSYKRAFLLSLLAWPLALQAQLVYEGQDLRNFGLETQYYLDKEAAMNFEEVLLLDEFKPMESEVPNLGLGSNAHWLKFDLVNKNSEECLLEIDYPILDRIDVYQLNEEGDLIDSTSLGEMYPFSKREYPHPAFIFPLEFTDSKSITVLLRVTSGEQVLIPMRISNYRNLSKLYSNEDLILGFYFGIVIVMMLYNLFVYFSTRDRSYLEYILYILSVGITQAILEGYGFKYIWPDSPGFALSSVYFGGAFSGIAVLIFVRSFLQTKRFLRWFDITLQVLIVLYLLSAVLAVLGKFNLSYSLINAVAGPGSILTFVGAILVYRKGVRSAKFFLIAWSIFLVSIIVFVLKDFGIVPYNSFTSKAVIFGSAIEIVLLAFALGDRINTLKLERAESRERELQALQEKEGLVRQQNVLLENMVAKRTRELEQTNGELQVAMNDLQSAQSQLVNAEKMASLGQLTAGIAHEINNPINFVTSNINPLKRDISDLKELLAEYGEIKGGEGLQERLEAIDKLKGDIELDYVMQEIDQLLNGIAEGADRTAEIVKGLKNFSRLDEAESKHADIHEGLDSALVILRPQYKNVIEVVEEYDRSIGEIECYPGKLNQVFVNLITNAIQAIEEHQESGEKKIVIKTTKLEDGLELRISDSGPGIPKEIQDKVFDPFFTTKQVGEGTGLGLSIVYSIIESHGGSIEISAEEGEGTTFIIRLPSTIKKE